MKKMFMLLLSFMLLFTLFASGCKDVSDNGNQTGEVIVQDGYLRMDMVDSMRKTEGVGTQFDTLIVEMQNNLNDEEWKIQTDALELMNLQSVRIRFYPEMYERNNDNLDPNSFDYDSPNVDFNSIEMKQLYRMLDVFELNDIKVDLSWYGCRTTFQSQDGKIIGSWLGGNYFQNNGLGWMQPPTLTAKPLDEFAESVAACLNYLVNTKKYSCIYEYSIFPEPDGILKNMNDLKAISDMIKTKLQAYGMGKVIKFSGPGDYGNDAQRYDSTYLSKVVFDKGTSSVYKFNAQSSNEEMLEFAKSYTKVTDKYGITWGIAESGTSNFLTAVSNSDTETYDRAIFMLRFFINMSNGGCTNIKYFIFGDCMYDGNLNMLGLFRYRHQQWKAKPVWYAWSAVTKYTDYGSDMYTINSSDKDVCAVAFRLPDGHWSYFAANNSNGAKKIAIVNPAKNGPKKMNIYRMTGSSIPESETLSLLPKFSDVEVNGGVVHLTVPANGGLIISNKG